MTHTATCRDRQGTVAKACRITLAHRGNYVVTDRMPVARTLTHAVW